MNILIIFIKCVILAVLGAPIRNIKIQELIIGGQPTNIEDFPYQVAFFYRNVFFCSGSILTETHIVTAAHCVVYFPSVPTNLTIRAGTSSTRTSGQIMVVKEIHIHPKFSLKYVDYDVAVVELESPLKFSNKIQSLKLGKTEPSDGDEVDVSGWGYQQEKGAPTPKLQRVKVKIIDRKVCAKSYAKKLKVTERMLCAGEDNKDACYGDSGGPLVHNGKLIGIVSSGEGCAREKYPGIYTSVLNSEVRHFILNITGLSE